MAGAIIPEVMAIYCYFAATLIIMHLLLYNLKELIG